MWLLFFCRPCIEMCNFGHHFIQTEFCRSAMVASPGSRRRAKGCDMADEVAKKSFAEVFKVSSCSARSLWGAWHIEICLEECARLGRGPSESVDIQWTSCSPSAFAAHAVQRLTVQCRYDLGRTRLRALHLRLEVPPAQIAQNTASIPETTPTSSISPVCDGPACCGAWVIFRHDAESRRGRGSHSRRRCDRRARRYHRRKRTPSRYPAATMS